MGPLGGFSPFRVFRVSGFFRVTPPQNAVLRASADKDHPRRRPVTTNLPVVNWSTEEYGNTESAITTLGGRGGQNNPRDHWPRKGSPSGLETSPEANGPKSRQNSLQNGVVDVG